MKLGISNIAWNSDESEEIYSLMKKYGFDGLEIAPTKVFNTEPYSRSDEEILKYKESINSKGFNIIALQSILYGRNDLKLFDTDTIDLLKAYIKSSIDFSNKLNAGIIIFGSPKNRIIKDDFKDKDIYKSFFREIGDYCSERNIKFCIETNPKEYGTNFVTTFKEQINILSELNNKGLGLHIDLGSMLLNKESFSLLNPYLNKIDHIHLSQPYLKAITDKNIGEYKEIKEILKGSKYEGYVSIEMAGSNLSNIRTVNEALQEVYRLFN